MKCGNYIFFRPLNFSLRLMGRLGFLVITASFVLGIGGLFGCGGEDGGDRNWSVQNGTLTLTETLRVTEGNDFFFGEIYDLAVRDDGQIYVADGEEHHIKVLSPNGELLETIGSEGEGPGELQRPFNVALANGDSLYVMDGQARVSVFAPKGDFEYSFVVRAETGAPRNMMVQEAGRFTFLYFPFPQRVVEGDAQVVARPVGLDGEPGDTLLAKRPYQRASLQHFVPFSRASWFASGPDDLIHHAWSDSLQVTVYDPEGTKQRETEIPFDPVPVTAANRRELLEDRSEEARRVIGEHLPDTKPAFDHFLVDDEGRYWFGRPTAHPDSLSWWHADPTEQRVVTAKLPSKVQFLEVKGGFAYGRTTTESGAPALVRYQIDVED